MQDATTYRPCPGCEATQFTAWPQYSQGEWQVVQCDDCDLTYLRNPVDYEALEDDFAWEKTYVEKTTKGGSTRLSGLVRKIRAATVGLHRDKQGKFREWFDDGHVLDIGCGTGDRIRPPMIPYGIELSNALHAKSNALMRKWGGYCEHGAGADAIWKFDAGQFDGIVMFSYLEHETEVLTVLKGAYRALKKQGGVFIRVPNFGSLNRRIIGPKWCGFRYPDHVNYFTLPTLRAIAAKAGFDTTLINSITLPIDDNISVLLRKTATP